MLMIIAILSAALFGLLSSMPGNPIDLLITSNPNVKPEDIARLKKLRGLDKPWYVQYLRWLVGYKEPARPPTIKPISPIKLTDLHQGLITVDLSEYLVDSNFVPSVHDVEQWLNGLWPEWRSMALGADIDEALSRSDISQVLLLLARVNRGLQDQLFQRMEKESSNALRLTGLFSARAQGLSLIGERGSSYLWFLVTNSYGQNRVGRVAVMDSDDGEPPDLMSFIDSKLAPDDDQSFKLDLKNYLIDPEDKEQAVFSLLGKTNGHMSQDGIYENHFRSDGQSVVMAKVSMADGRSQQFAFDVEHGVVGRKDKFNRGFIYFFTGDRDALGFSQTYKRPVYDLLFGEPLICGDGRVDSGETCDDGNRNGRDGCGTDCFYENDSLLKRADVTIGSYILRSGRIGNTIQLMLPAILLSLFIAIPLGVFSAYRQYSLLDYLLNFLAFIGISLPVFWFGIMMIYLFAENFQIFPAGGVQTPGIYEDGSVAILTDRMKHAILPTVVLSIFYTGRWLRYMRASMLETLPMDYIRTARAKGLSEPVVIIKHAFRNALIPVVTILALSIPSLFGGAVLTETVFSWPGIGRLQYEAVMNSDYYVAIVVFLISAALVMVGNLLADAVYLWVDPRIRKQ